MIVALLTINGQNNFPMLINVADIHENKGFQCYTKSEEY